MNASRVERPEAMVKAAQMLRAAMRALGFSYDQFAAAIGMTSKNRERTVRRWAGRSGSEIRRISDWAWDHELTQEGLRKAMENYENRDQ